ncbi:MAG TPA: radical SAM protein [Gemmatimonadota bacterium]|nr:radical SAM protein [Gemmatimonadota bacterium]
MSTPIPLESLLRPNPAAPPAPPSNGQPYTNGNGKRPGHTNGNGHGMPEIELPIGPPLRFEEPLEELDLSIRRHTWGKKARLLKAFLLGRPVWVTWQVTYNCNYGCSFCTYWKNDFKPHEENSLEDFAVGARKLSELGSLIVSLAGGEPMLRRDIHHIVDIVARDHFPYLTTSGSGMTTKRARQLWEAGLWGCSVSIDYADPEKHAEHRGVKFAFERAIKAIEQLMEARTDLSYQRVQIISVLTDDNLDEMPKLCELARKLGVYWQVQPYSVMKTGNEGQRHLRGATEVLMDLKRRYPDTFHTNRLYLERFDEAVNDGISGCIAGRAMFNIDNQMVVSKCVEFNLTEPCGNLRSEDMRTVLGRLHEAHERNTCTACWYSCRGEVEVLYEPRGFLNSMHSFLWQSRRQPAVNGVSKGD